MDVGAWCGCARGCGAKPLLHSVCMGLVLGCVVCVFTTSFLAAMYAAVIPSSSQA